MIATPPPIGRPRRAIAPLTTVRPAAPLLPRTAGLASAGEPVRAPLLTGVRATGGPGTVVEHDAGQEVVVTQLTQAVWVLRRRTMPVGATALLLAGQREQTPGRVRMPIGPGIDRARLGAAGPIMRRLFAPGTRINFLGNLADGTAVQQLAAMRAAVTGSEQELGAPPARDQPRPVGGRPAGPPGSPRTCGRP